MDDQRNEAQEQVQDAVEPQGGAGGNGGGGAGSWLFRKEILIPLGATAATAAASVASRKLPDLLDRMKEKTGEAGENALSAVGEEGKQRAQEAISNATGGGLVGTIASKALGGGGKGKQNKAKTRRLPIQRWTDVAVPVEEAYQAWKRFDDYPKFMHRVREVQQSDENMVKWTEKIWFSTRQWEAEIIDDRENDRIAWQTRSGTSHTGVVSFHRLSDNLTRVMATIDFQPAGLLEKMASGLRFAKRAAQADLARFKAYVEFEQSNLEGTPQQQAQAAEDGGEERSDEDQEGQEQQQEGRQEQQARGRGRSRTRKEDETGSSEESDEEREAARREREQRRDQRREGATA